MHTKMKLLICLGVVGFAFVTGALRGDRSLTLEETEGLAGGCLRKCVDYGLCDDDNDCTSYHTEEECERWTQTTNIDAYRDWHCPVKTDGYTTCNDHNEQECATTYACAWAGTTGCHTRVFGASGVDANVDCNDGAGAH